MVELLVQSQNIIVLSTPTLVSGTQDYKVHFTFDETWDNYVRVAVFQIVDECEDNTFIKVLPDTYECEIPRQVLKSNCKIRIGVFGINGEERLPTVYSARLLVREGVASNKYITVDEQGLFEQIIEYTEYVKNQIGNLEDLSTQAKDTLVNAINEIFDHNNLTNRDGENQHPISAITDLQEDLDSLQEQINTKQDTIEDLEEIREGASLGRTAVQHNELSQYQSRNIVDSGDYYTSDTVEGALQQIGAVLFHH